MRSQWRLHYNSVWEEKIFCSTRQSKFFLLVLFNLLAIAALYFIKIQPLWQQCQQAKRDFIVQSDLLQAQQKQFQQVEDQQKQMTASDQLLAVNTDDAQRVVAMTTLAQQQGITLTAIKLANKKIEDPLSLDWILTGNYWQLYRWLREVVKLPVKITQFSLAREDKQLKALTLTMTIIFSKKKEEQDARPLH